MVRSTMTLIIVVGSNIKYMMTLTLYLMQLKKIVEIKYAYDFLNQPMAQKILWGVTILFISHRLLAKVIFP